jgi:parallel beta-helix repeat protein
MTAATERRPRELDLTPAVTPDTVILVDDPAWPYARKLTKSQWSVLTGDGQDTVEFISSVDEPSAKIGKVILYARADGVRAKFPDGRILVLVGSDDILAERSRALAAEAAIQTALTGFTTPQAHGALGDGSHDDLAAFRAALATNLPVHVPYTVGGYRLSSTLELTSGDVLKGSGAGDKRALLLLEGTSDGLTIGATAAAADILIEDILIDGRSSVHPDGFVYGIHVPGAFSVSRLTIRRVGVRNVTLAGMLILGDVGAPNDSITVDFCDTHDTGYHGICQQGFSDNTRLTNNHVRRWGRLYPESVGLVAGRQSRNVFIHGNDVFGDGTELSSGCHAISCDLPTSGAVVSGNSCGGAVGFGIEMGLGTGSVCQGNTILGNVGPSLVVDGALTPGIYVSVGHAVTGNIVREGKSHGLYVFVGAADGSLRNSDILLANNTVIDCDGCGMLITDVDGVNITGNYFCRNKQSGIYFIDVNNILFANNTIRENNLFPTQALVSLTEIGGIVIATTSTPHGFIVGDYVALWGAVQTGYATSAAPVYAVPNATTFQYAAAAGLVSPATGVLRCAKVRSLGQQAIIQAWSHNVASLPGPVVGINRIVCNGLSDTVTIV